MLQNYDNQDSSEPRRGHAAGLLVPTLGATFVTLVLVLGTLVGILVDRSGWIEALLPGVPERAPPGIGPTFRPFWEAWNLVDEHYVDRKAIKPENMTEGAINGMLASLGDVGHTAYVNKKEFHDLEDGLKGTLEGIGAYMGLRNARPTITATVPGSPARAAGLKPGDVLIAVDDQDMSEMSLNEIVNHVRGPAGTTVHLKVMRAGVANPIELNIERAHVDIADVSWQMLPGTDIAHIAIINFGNQADDQLRQALDGARKKGAKKLLVDVRENRGGLKEQAVAVTSEFLKSGVVFIEQNAKGERTEVPVKEGGQATDIPMCLLIDEGTASSAEIFAGAIQDYKRAKLVGSKTFGTGTVLQPFKLSDGGAVLLAVAEWLTPKGRRIWHNGITPDVPVALPPGEVEIIVPGADKPLTAESLAKSTDKQLLAGINVLEGKPVEKEGSPTKK